MAQLTLARTRTNIRLGQELGRGGEGVVFAIEGQRDQVAKVYLAAVERRRTQKLNAMVEFGNSALWQIAAWPIDLLIDSKEIVRGFVMPRVMARRDIHELYSPKSRSEAFPEADFRFLVHTAGNIARAFAVVHAHGHIVGDVNHGNLLVGPDGTVMMIDCDSFQVASAATVFTCDVGVPLFTAPELHGRSFRGLVRAPNHDLFGLAVLLFHLLYLGRHPFAGRYIGPGEMPIERAVAEYRFAYGPDRTVASMEKPPGTIPLETMGATITQLFIRAFRRPTGSPSRPDANEWLGALEALKSRLQACGQASWHHYPRALAACPWCTIEAQTSVRLFGQRFTTIGLTDSVNLATLWRAIAAVPEPGLEPALPTERPWRPPPGVKLPNSIVKNFRKTLSIAFIGIGLTACNVVTKDWSIVAAILSYVAALAVWPRVAPETKAAAERAYSAAKAEWDGALGRWQREASREIFAERLRVLDEARATLADMPNLRRRRIARLESEREMRQLERYLDRFRIDRARIEGIGTGRTAMLAAYGIETAADIERSKIGQIPGFGVILTNELVHWRRGHERNFRFNPSEPIDRRDLDALDREMEARRQELLTKLQQGPHLLRRIGQEISAAQQRLMPALEKAWTSFKVAEAGFKSLR